MWHVYCLFDYRKVMFFHKMNGQLGQEQTCGLQKFIMLTMAILFIFRQNINKLDIMPLEWLFHLTKPIHLAHIMILENLWSKIQMGLLMLIGLKIQSKHNKSFQKKIYFCLKPQFLTLKIRYLDYIYQLISYLIFLNIL